MLCQSALEVEAWQFLQMAHFSCESLPYLIPHSLNQQRKQKRPTPPWDESLPLQRLQSQTSECWNLKRRNKPRTAPRTGNGVTEHRSSIRQSLARRLPGSVMRGLCQRGPCPSRGSPERPKPYKADCVRSHDCC